jgi:hypothetical protein
VFIGDLLSLILKFTLFTIAHPGKEKLITIHSIVIKPEKNICQELWQLNRNEIANSMAIVLIPFRL